MKLLDRDPVVNLPPACAEGSGRYVGWTYYVPHAMTTVSGVEIPFGDDISGLCPINIADRANDGINRRCESANWAGAIVIARYCQNDHQGEGSRVEIGDTYIVADSDTEVPLGPTKVSFAYGTTETFESCEQVDWARPLLLPFSEGAPFPTTILPTSQGKRRFFVARPIGAWLVDKNLLTQR